MEFLNMIVYASLCTALIAVILRWKHETRNWERMQEKLVEETAEREVRLKQAHEDELADMADSCELNEAYERNRFNQLNEAFVELQIKHELLKSMSRKLRPGFDVEATARAIEAAKGVRVG